MIIFEMNKTNKSEKHRVWRKRFGENKKLLMKNNNNKKRGNKVLIIELN